MHTRSLILILLTLLTMTTRAQALADAPLLTGTISDTGSRAWTVYRNSHDDQLLVLLAPRDADSNASFPIKAAPLGQVQAMRTLGNRNPLAIAAIDDRIYLVYPPGYANKVRQMRVYSATAAPGSVGGMWILSPSERLESNASIQTKGDLVDLQPSAEALYALLKENDTPSLVKLVGNAWVPIELPDSINPRNLDLVALGDHIVLVDRSGPVFKAQMYHDELDQWEAFTNELPIGRSTQLLSGQRSISVLDWDEGDRARLRVWSASGIYTIATSDGVPIDARYALLDSSETLIAIRAVEPSEDPSEDETKSSTVELLEYDSTSLQQRFVGDPIASSPVSAEEFRFLVGMMMLIMLGVLVVVILPDRSSIMRIPEGCVLADPGRRLIATMLDAILVASIVGWVFDVGASEILTLSVIVRPDNAWGVIPATIISGVCFSAVCEWLMCATPGKLLMGLKVVRAQPEVVERPKLWSALVRNIIKWVLPPVAALALIDQETLHRGDRASRTLVVMPRPVDKTPADDQG